MGLVVGNPEVNCFVKFIESPTDRAVRGEFSGGPFSPFTLLAFSGFDVQPSREEVRFLLDLMTGLSEPSSALLTCRNSEERANDFDQDAKAHYEPLHICEQNRRAKT